MIKVYGAPICSGCVELKNELDKRQIGYEFIDITASVANLRAFLVMRDTMPMFDQIKKEGRIGIPVVEFEDGTRTLDFEEQLKEDTCEFC